jgi:two-component system, OmpR family, sensor histidine kinase MtrB
VRFRPRRFGLRARITLAFALGSLLLSVTLSASTWAFTRQAQLNQREASAIDRLYTNARNLRETLLAGGETDLREYLMNGLPTPAEQVLWVRNVPEPDIYATGDVQFSDLPLGLRELVADGQPATMRYRTSGDAPLLAVGVPLPAASAQYYEVVTLDDLERSFELLGLYLTAASLVTALGGAALGWWASRRTLLPLVDVGSAAQAIAGGRLDTRLESANDPDLAVLVSSFNEMAAALQARIERDARFASDVSHELRSPLMTLAASIEVLQTRRDELPERSRAALDLLVHDVNRFQQLVADLLEISRFDSGAAHLELEPVLLAEFLTQAVRASSLGASEPAVPVVAEGSLREMVVEVDKRRMARVVTNLLDNAQKYGGGATSIILTRRGDLVEFAVQDAGEGVAPEDRERIFDRFSRGSSAGSRGTDSGTGLGLALVTEHVRLHGGTIRVENRGDGVRGASFVVSLPIPSTDPSGQDHDPAHASLDGPNATDPVSTDA